MSKPIFVLNGPNLNLLGQREPHIYGTATLADAEKASQDRAKTVGFAVDFRQTNHEGVLIDWLHEARNVASAVVLNAGGLTHTSIALLDALKALTIPAVEVHLSNPQTREEFRKQSFVSLGVAGSIAGFGVMSYELGVEAAARLALNHAAQNPRT
ncbi:MAG: type II 3-dehydroquinate dehydratase [Caulobacterales bacterium]